ELNSEPVNDAMFNRNVAVADRLNVNIVSAPIEDPNQFLPIEEIKRAVKAGSDEYDLVAAAAYVAAPAVQEGTFYDLTELLYLDLSKDYWMQDYNEAMSYQDRQFTATGAIALSTYRFAFVTMFNKETFDNKGVPYLYEAVANNEWTLDYQASLAEDFYADTNGTGKKDEGDFYGFVSCWGINVDAYWASCDLPIVQKDADGYYEFVLDIERYSNVMDKVLYLFYECGGTSVYDAITDNEEQDLMRLVFSRGESAMTTLRLIAVEQPDVRDMEQAYGIVPVPKYDAAQASYGTIMHDQFTVFAVPVSASAKKLELIGATMEVMASESMRTVKPAYYEIALKRKYMSDPVAWEMLDLIFQVMRIDPAVVYVDALGGPHQTMRSIVASKRNTVASTCKKMANNVTKQINKLQKKLDNLE
ncbi:MAG: hypothetical protein IKZ16_05480, partial [Clostridia bacterium]|nr:hypothetical protein [Clostridia bacterium]